MTKCLLSCKVSRSRRKVNHKVAIVGNIAGVANELVVGLRHLGYMADLFIGHDEAKTTLDDVSGQRTLKAEWIRYLDQSYHSRYRVLDKILKEFYGLVVCIRLFNYDIIHSHTGSLNFSIFSYFLFVKGHLKKYLAFATGSDIREVARFDQTWRGKLMRDYFKNAARVFLLNIDMLSFKDEMGLLEASFFPFAINEEKFFPDKKVKKPELYQGKLLCFMMSNLDFGSSDRGHNRNSMKKNDRFFYALAEFIKEDTNIHAFVLDRGSDRDVAKEIVNNLGIASYVQFLPPMTELERIHYLNMADVILDQFNLGSFGLGALEALSVGKPLITHLRMDCIAKCYDVAPPILYAQTAKEIFLRLLEARNLESRQELSRQARQWLIRYHSRQTVITQLISHYRDITN